MQSEPPLNLQSDLLRRTGVGARVPIVVVCPSAACIPQEPSVLVLLNQHLCEASHFVMPHEGGATLELLDGIDWFAPQVSERA